MTMYQTKEVFQMKIKDIEFFENSDFNIKGGINFNIFNEVGGWRYVNIGQLEDRTIYIDSDGQRLDQVKYYFEDLIERAKFHDEGIEETVKDFGDALDNMEVTLVKIADIWKPHDGNNGGISVIWSVKDFGFGETVLYLSKEGKLMIDSEMLPKDFCIWIFNKALEYHWRNQ